jgi:N,N'-diacetyllegionaminate synthase
MPIPELRIADQTIGPGRPCFVVAEAGVNHGGSLEAAIRLIDVAKAAGANAVKFQTFKAEQVMTANAPKAAYQLRLTNPKESQLEMARALELPYDAFRALQQHCQQTGMLFLSTPFDHDSVDFLVSLGVPALKIPSGEINNFPFLERCARSGKPVILSTGMSYLSEVDEAIRVLRDSGCSHLALLHCVSAYPADPKEANLRAMRTMSRAFQVPVGLSDHTMGCVAAVAAVALGACIIEKHFTLDKSLPGPDHRASLEPGELADLVRMIREVEGALGTGAKAPAPGEIATREMARRSLVLRCDVAQGKTIDDEALIALRPPGGIAPSLLRMVVGRRAARDLCAGDQLHWTDLA